jgi:diadenosine tetraphosphate (Ap4A) HIT family hydrolase
MPYSGSRAFELDPRIEGSTLPVSDLALSQVRLMDQADVPWLVLVPRRADVVEMHHLPAADQAQLWRELGVVAALMERLFTPDKMNVVNLGMMVRQLHVHVIARFERDPCWPRPVWTGAGGLTPRPYEPSDRDALLARLRAGLEPSSASPQG